MGNTLACVFPGQGSQRVGMLADIAAQEPIVRSCFDEASAVLGYDLWELAARGPQELQNLTERTQPLTLTASVALWRLWLARGGRHPAYLAGHSLGELTALVCAGSIDFAVAVALVRNRGAYMQNAVPLGTGAMAAVLGLEDEDVQAACSESADGQVVEAVNFNTPGQVVIAGHAGAVERAIVACKRRGAKRAMPLPVSAPFHTSLMQPVGERLAVDLAAVQLAAPRIPVIHNVHAQAESDPGRIRELIVRQAYSPVLWVDCVRHMVGGGIRMVVELGPGRVLGGMCKRIDSGLVCHSSEDPADLSKALEAAAC